MIFESIKNEAFEQIIFCHDSQVDLRAIVALHSTVLGPAVGGCRMWNYASEAEALTDVLRLSKGMTYKAAISELNWGGGKAVIIGDPKIDKTERKFERFGEFVERLGGHYITAKDVGTNAEDLKCIKRKTSHILGIEGETGSSGDPSPATAWGVFHGMRSCVKHTYGANTIKGLTIALQGLGSVSYYLIEHLLADGAKIIGCDIDQEKINRIAQKYHIEITRPDSIYDVACDIFSPSALGASINENTLPRIRAKVIAGAANNQLSMSEIGYEILRKGLIYAPDYAINAGGLINIYHEKMFPAKFSEGYNHKRAFDHVERIGITISEILDRSKREKIPTHKIADTIVEERIKKARK
ncbi:MAG: Glu/Leu/Phe/Val dehydrogenase [Bdellovibrio sp.]|nr:Glu/Leu/Phe/Val dehydrogenase [Bdellovibrio sp.]